MAPTRPSKSVDLTAFKSISPNTWVTGDVVSVAKFGAFVNVTLPGGESAVGLLHISKLRSGFVGDMESEMSVGQSVEVCIDKVDLEQGNMWLSGKDPDLSAFEFVPPDTWLTGNVVHVRDIGASVKITLPSGESAVGWLPVSRIRQYFVQDAQSELSVGQNVEVSVDRLDLEQGKMWLKGKDNSFQNFGDMSAFQSILPNTWVNGTVLSVQEFGAFVKVTLPAGDSAVGWLPISKIRKGFVENIESELSVGQNVEVGVDRVDLEEGKMYLTGKDDLFAFASMKKAEGWVMGTVVRTFDFGALVSVTLPGGETAVGWLDVSKIGRHFVGDVEKTKELEVGQNVEVSIAEVDLEKRKMWLTEKSLYSPILVEPADLSAFEGISADQWLTGKVARATEFGAFVTVTAPDGKATATGLVHSTQMKDTLVSVKKTLKREQAVQVRIQALDLMGGTLSLTMKDC